MITNDEIKILLSGRAAVDTYLKARATSDRAEAIKQLEKDLFVLDFREIDSFFEFNCKASMLEIFACHKAINRLNPSAPPLCDGCKNRNVTLPDCCKDPKTLIEKDFKFICATTRFSSQETWKPKSISLEEDAIYQEQLALRAKYKMNQGLVFSIMDALDWWDYPDHTPPSCCVAYPQIADYRFDPFWRSLK